MLVDEFYVSLKRYQICVTSWSKCNQILIFRTEILIVKYVEQKNMLQKVSQIYKN